MTFQILDLLKGINIIDMTVYKVILNVFSYPNIEAILAMISLEGQTLNYLIAMIIKIAYYTNNDYEFQRSIQAENIFRDIQSLNNHYDFQFIQKFIKIAGIQFDEKK